MKKPSDPIRETITDPKNYIGCLVFSIPAVLALVCIYFILASHFGVVSKVGEAVTIEVQSLTKVHRTKGRSYYRTVIYCRELDRYEEVDLYISEGEAIKPNVKFRAWRTTTKYGNGSICVDYPDIKEDYEAAKRKN